MFCGVRISATGQLIKRNDYKPSGEVSDEKLRQRMMLVQRVADELRQFNFPGEAPSLSVKFSGDLSRFEAARAEATLHSDRLRRGSYEMKNLVVGEWANQTLNLTQCEWTDHAGSFSVGRVGVGKRRRRTFKRGVRSTPSNSLMLSVLDSC